MNSNPLRFPKRLVILPLNPTPWGGSELLWSDLASLWHQQGHKVHVGIRAWNPFPNQILNLAETGVEIKPYRLRASKARRVLTSITKLSLQTTRLRHPLYNWLVQIKPDLLVISADCMGGLPGIELAATLNLPFAYIQQANSESWWPDDQVRQQMNSALDATKGRLFFVSERNRKLFELQLGRRLPEAQICWNPHGAHGLDPLPWPNTDLRAHSELRLAFVGRLEPVAKGQDVLFQVLAQPHWRERSWHLTLYGNGHAENGVRAMADMLGIHGHLDFVPAYRSLVDVWSNHHALVLTSRYEGLPLSLVEAMWLGRPALVTDVADCSLLLRDGLDGFVASAPTVELVSKALECLWVKRHNLSLLGQSAARRVREFMPNDPVMATSDMILSMLSRPARMPT